MVLTEIISHIEFCIEGSEEVCKGNGTARPNADKNGPRGGRSTLCRFYSDAL